MANEDLKVITKAKQLAKHTLIVTSNARRYPKKYRFSLVDKMQNKALEIYESLFEANRTDLKDYKRERLELQTKAITHCDELMYFIELSYELGIINSGGMEAWSQLIKDSLEKTGYGTIKELWYPGNPPYIQPDKEALINVATSIINSYK